MRKHVLIGLSLSLCLFGISGCCKKIWPQKIIFPPDLQMTLDEEISRLGIENPLLLIVSQDGQTIALTTEGQTFSPCQPPVAPMEEKTDRSYQGTQPESNLPLCKGMVDIREFYPFKTITVASSRRNPFCIIVRTPDGGYQERCFPLPGE